MTFRLRGRISVPVTVSYSPELTQNNPVAIGLDLDGLRYRDSAFQNARRCGREFRWRRKFTTSNRFVGDYAGGLRAGQWTWCRLLMKVGVFGIQECTLRCEPID